VSRCDGNEQADAVRLGVGSELAFVIGPAGCGKSRVVARVCEALVRRGDRVLLLAPSNRAVDLALNKVVERLASEFDGTNGYPILRVGGGVTSQLSENARKHTALEHILDRLLGDGSADHNWTELPDQHRSQLRQTLVWSCKLAAATLHNACLSRLLREGNWDAVVIDEASMAIPPILFLAARLARQRVVVIGDHNQLPPVVQTKDPVAQRWLLRDVFDLSGIPEAIEDEDPPRCLVMLTRQFRMAAQIARLHNEVFYTGRLETDDAPELRDPPLGCESLLYVNSGRLIPRSRTEQVDGSRRNPGHVEIIAALVHRIEHRARGVPTLILSPFRSQVRAIREVLGRRRAIDIGTIHSCQGSEAKIVVLDLTEGWGCRQTSFLSRDELRWMGNRLLNVAISRAEQHLILVADFDYFEEGYNRAGTYTWAGS
jgi:hypothetical protein